MPALFLAEYAGLIFPGGGNARWILTGWVLLLLFTVWVVQTTKRVRRPGLPSGCPGGVRALPRRSRSMPARGGA